MQGRWRGHLKVAEGQTTSGCPGVSGRGWVIHPDRRVPPQNRCTTDGITTERTSSSESSTNPPAAPEPSPGPVLTHPVFSSPSRWWWGEGLLLRRLLRNAFCHSHTTFMGSFDRPTEMTLEWTLRHVCPFAERMSLKECLGLCTRYSSLGLNPQRQ